MVAQSLRCKDLWLSLRVSDCLSCRLCFVEVAPDGFGGFAGDYGGEGFGGGLLDVAEAAEVGDEALAGLLAYAGDVEEL